MDLEGLPGIRPGAGIRSEHHLMNRAAPRLCLKVKGLLGGLSSLHEAENMERQRVAWRRDSATSGRSPSP